MIKNFSVLALLAASILGVSTAHSAIGTIDNVPAATLLAPHFEVDPAGTGNRTVLSVGNASGTEQLAHVTLWTDYGVPTFSFDLRLPARGITEINLRDLFIGGNLPQSTAGGIASCAGLLPPAALSQATLTGLRNAHSGQASSLLSGQCGSRTAGNYIGYATIDAVSACSTGNAVFPGGSGYFVGGGLGVASNNNVLFGEAHTTNPSAQTSYGDTLVHIEASASDALTDGAGDYTFYGRRVSASGADNRESLPANYMARYAGTTASNPNQVISTSAIIWRDPGVAASFPCSTNPAGLPIGAVIAFDHQERVNGASQTFLPRRATQHLGISTPFREGMISYNLGFDDGVFATNQAFVSHVHTTNSSLTTTRELAQLSATPSTNTELSTNVISQCGDGIDNDNDGFTDFPADTGCVNATTGIEAPACRDGLDNDMDMQTDFPADIGCSSPFAFTESTECSNGGDDDMDTLIDFPADPGCRSNADLVEADGLNNQCSDGIDNDNDGVIDFPLDSDCQFPNDQMEAQGACGDGFDNDGDGQIDFPADSGCDSLTDNNEALEVCRDGIDNDMDGFTDFPADTGCATATSGIENPQCADGIDNDMDGDTDFPADAGCLTRTSSPEGTQCDDGVDNDGDMLTDFPADPGCQNAQSTVESPRCNNTFDDDFDGDIDFPDDVGCSAAWDNEEFETQCNDGIDNDGDGATDFPNSVHCTGTFDDSEAPACSDGEDNDNDGLTDFPADLGCSSATDGNELLGLEGASCSDGLDNDVDGFTDWPADNGCAGAGDDTEATLVQTLGTPVRTIPVNNPLALLMLMFGVIAMAGIVLNRRH